MNRTLAVVGASRGIGKAIAEHFHGKGDRVYAISRSPAPVGAWIQADVSGTEGIEKIKQVLNSQPLDALLFMGGVWEENAFTHEFDLLKSSDEETRFVIGVNLIAPIEVTKALAENLSQAQNPRAIYIGALSGLDHSATKEVANTASKFGLRGAIQALRIALKRERIGFTVINPGNVATEEVMQDIEAGRFSPQTPIPMADVISAIEWILSLSPAVDTGDINLWQK
ncbi:MAG: SDR family oxidoreductase [Cyanobacteria bacterium P01_D01_bin.36]